MVLTKLGGYLISYKAFSRNKEHFLSKFKPNERVILPTDPSLNSAILKLVFLLFLQVLKSCCVSK